MWRLLPPRGSPAVDPAHFSTEQHTQAPYLSLIESFPPGPGDDVGQELPSPEHRIGSAHLCREVPKPGTEGSVGGTHVKRLPCVVTSPVIRSVISTSPVGRTISFVMWS